MKREKEKNRLQEHNKAPSHCLVPLCPSFFFYAFFHRVYLGQYRVPIHRKLSCLSPSLLHPPPHPTLKSCISLIRTKRRKLGWSEFAFSNPFSSTRGGEISLSPSLPRLWFFLCFLVSLSHPIHCDFGGESHACTRRHFRRPRSDSFSCDCSCEFVNREVKEIGDEEERWKEGTWKVEEEGCTRPESRMRTLVSVELFRVRKFFKVSIDFDSLKFPHLPIWTNDIGRVY